MIYVKKLHLPSEFAEIKVIEDEKRTCFNTFYPFKIFPEMRLGSLEFDGITPVTPGDVRNLCIQAGAHCYCADFDAGVWCSCNIAAVIARESGVHTLRLPEKRKMIPLFTDGEAITSDHVEITLKCGEVAAFRLAPK